MSARLQLRVHKIMLGDSAVSGAVAELLPISDDKGAKFYSDVIIPVNSHDASKDDTREIDVVPGRYLVRAFLPSGRMLSTQVVAIANQTTKAVLKTEEAPHEWLGWQGLMGQNSFFQTALSLPPINPTIALTDVSDGAATWRKLCELVRRPAASIDGIEEALQGKRVRDISPQTFSDAATVSFVFGTNSLPPDRLRYGIIERGSRWDLVSLPLPWHRLNRSFVEGQASVDVAVPRQVESRPSVVIHDEQLGALLGFVASGRLPLATAVSAEGTTAHAHMRLALQRKLENPFAAACGAYMLLQSDSTQDAEWHQWVKNLANWFPWLPDGAALLGALRLRNASTEQEVLEARTAFEQAWKRGIPVLAPVLRLLLDGVSTIVGDPDADSGAELEAMLYSVRAVASVMATDQPFTSLRLGGER